MVEHGYAQAPASRKVITEDKVDTIVSWAKSKGLGIDQIAEKYDFESDAVREAIIDALGGEDLPE